LEAAVNELNDKLSGRGTSGGEFNPIDMIKDMLAEKYPGTSIDQAPVSDVVDYVLTQLNNISGG
jgi:hypothetical protein